MTVRTPIEPAARQLAGGLSFATTPPAPDDPGLPKPEVPPAPSPPAPEPNPPDVEDPPPDENNVPVREPGRGPPMRAI